MKILLPAQRPVEWALELTLIDSLRRPALSAGSGVLVLRATANLEPTDVIYQQHYQNVSVKLGLEGYVEYLSVIVYRVWLVILFGSSTGVKGLPSIRPLQAGAAKEPEQTATTASSPQRQKHSDNVFDVVPQPSRIRLVKRFDEYLGNERRRRYDKLYELLYGHDSEEKQLNKQPYVGSRIMAEDERGILEEFIPISVIDLKLSQGHPLTLRIKGRAKLFCNGQTVIKEMVVHARFQDDDWYFSEISDPYQRTD